MSGKFQEVIEDFMSISDPLERYELLFEYAEEINLLNKENWSDKTRIQGCQSEAHIELNFNQDGKATLKGAADAMIMQGLISLTSMAVEGLTALEVLHFDEKFLSEIGISQSLTPSRSNGFSNMIQMMRKLAEEQL